MLSLEATINLMNNSGGAASSLRKHLKAVGVSEWSDLTRSTLYALKDYLARNGLATGTQKTVLANLKSIMGRVRDEVSFPSDYAKILSVKSNQNLKTFLTEEDLQKLSDLKVPIKTQQFVQNVFLVCAYTGLRYSDAIKLTPENIVGNNLHYVAKKTKKIGAIPLKKGLEERIYWIYNNQDAKVSKCTYNRTTRKLCKRAGIDEDVLVFKRDTEMRGPKWKFITSHSARVSTATCLSRRGVQISDIQQLLQHSSVAITEKYIVRDRIQLSSEAMAFFA